MGFTTESLAPTSINTNPNQPSEFNLSSKEFIGYDPKGTTTITGSDISENRPVAQTPAQAPVSEVPKEETVTLSSKTSALARKEMAQRAREKDLATKERSFAEKMADAEKYRKLTEKLANKDYSAVDELGLNYEEIVKHELSKEAQRDPAQERIQKLEEEQKSLRQALEEKEVKEYQANQALWKQEVTKVVSENPEFSTVKELGAEDIVLQHINDSFEEDGIELTVEQAAKDIEDALFERAEKFASVSKIKNRGGTATKVLGAPKTAIKTITQDMTTTPKTSPASKPFHLMNEHEQIQEAIRRVQAAKLQR